MTEFVDRFQRLPGQTGTAMPGRGDWRPGKRTKKATKHVLLSSWEQQQLNANKDIITHEQIYSAKSKAN